MAVNTLSADAKDALARDIPASAHCATALLTGLALYGGDRRSGTFATQRNAVARLFHTLALRVWNDAPSIRKVAGARLARTPTYRLALPIGFADAPVKPTRKCDRVAEARAAFLACGSLSAAANGYHLEFVVANAALHARLEWTLRALGLPPKTMERKRRSVLYYKDAETIVDVLTTIGAHGAVLHIQDVRAIKDTKNRIHRLVNTEAANLDRSASAAAAQRRLIEYVSAAYGLHRLTPALREIADLRLAHADESLAELGRRCNPPIGKATVNSRFGAIARLARGSRGERPSAARRH